MYALPTSSDHLKCIGVMVKVLNQTKIAPLSDRTYIQMVYKLQVLLMRTTFGFPGWKNIQIYKQEKLRAGELVAAVTGFVNWFTNWTNSLD